MRVQVYFNLHKKVFSIRDMKTRRVIGHSSLVHLENVKFKVSQAGRKRVLDTKRKNVHAFVEGDLLDTISTDVIMENRWGTAFYDPYNFETFVNRVYDPVHEAKYAICNGARVKYA
jgi:hypothetical protein